MADHYATLGVARTATPDEIKKAFRKLASQHHPDKGGNTAKFQEIQAAYDTLSDPAKRQQYDNPAPQGFNFNFGGAPGGAQFNDIFAQMFGGGMNSPFGQQHPRRNHVRMTLWVTNQDAARGGNRTINIGTAQGSQTVAIVIPQGVDDGDNVQYGGLAPGGQDLVIQYRIQPDAAWQRQGLDMHTEKRVVVWDLIVGGDLEVETIYGDTISLRIPPGTQTGQILRARGHGVRNQNGQQGDFMIHLQAEIPRNLDPNLVDAIQNYRK